MKKKGIIITLMAIAVVLLAVVCILLWKVTQKEKPKEPETQEETKQEEKFEEVSIDDNLVTDAKKFLPTYLCGGMYLNLGENNKTMADFSNEEKINMMVSIFEDGIIKTAMDGSMYSVDEKEAAKYFADLSFMDEYKGGVDTAYDIKTGKAEHEGAKGITDTIIPFYVVYNNGKYDFTSYGTGCVGPSNNGYYYNVAKAKKSDSKLVVEFYRYYAISDYDDVNETFYKKIYVKEGDSTEADITKTELFDHYEMIFNIEDGNMQLQEINYLA